MSDFESRLKEMLAARDRTSAAHTAQQAREHAAHQQQVEKDLNALQPVLAGMTAIAQACGRAGIPAKVLEPEIGGAISCKLQIGDDPRYTAVCFRQIGKPGFHLRLPNTQGQTSVASEVFDDDKVARLQEALEKWSLNHVYLVHSRA